MHVVVIGAGIAGLGAAFELSKHDVSVTVLESDAEVGGRCRSFEWHGSWHHTGAEALVGCEVSLTQLRQELAREAAPTVDLEESETVRGERIYNQGRPLLYSPFTLAGALRLPGGIKDKLSLLRLVPLVLRQRRVHDPLDYTCTLWADQYEGAAYLRAHAPQLFDAVIEPFMQYSTLDSGDYGLSWLLFALGDLAWLRSWWIYEPRGSGGITYELGQALQRNPLCRIVTSAPATAVRRTGEGIEVGFRRDGADLTLDADAVIVAVPGSLVMPIVGDLLNAVQREFLGRISYSAHHLGRYLVDVPASQLPAKCFLPSAEGFERLGKVSVKPDGKDRSVITLDLKDAYARCTVGRSDREVLAESWLEAIRAFPILRTAVIEDQILTRNDIAICRRPRGFVGGLAQFLAQPMPAGVELAGDYLLQSTVGRSLYTGVVAANRTLGHLGLIARDAAVRPALRSGNS
ncbi:FAD-dependent oxidoreductase [Mycobacterium arosiense]|nr:FAD-dependent oxidoreductase [Mycobacterium arosiense]